MSEKITYVGAGEFEPLLAGGVVLADFTASWCGPCKMLAPVLEKVALKVEGKVTVVKVDIEKEQNLAAQFQVTSVPTMILFKGGKEAARLVGLRSEEEIVRFALA